MNPKMSYDKRDTIRTSGKSRKASAGTLQGASGLEVWNCPRLKNDRSE